MRVKQVLKSIDAFPRAEDHLLQKTQSGALGNSSALRFIFISVVIDTFCCSRTYFQLKFYECNNEHPF